MVSKNFSHRPNGHIFTKEESREKVKLLVQDFIQEVKAGRLKGSIDETKAIEGSRSGSYQEESVKISFIAPLFEALNWSTSDNNEVRPEEHVSSGFIDYLFLKSGKAQFVVEAKRPSEVLDLETSSGRKYAKQAIGYGKVVAGVNFAIVTDFEELIVFHTYINPPEKFIVKNKLFSLKWTEFDSKFDLLWLFSKSEFDQANSQNKLKSLISEKNVIKSSKPVDKALLEDLIFWREKLANSIWKSLSSEIQLVDLTIVVQTLINRALFIRGAEDHGLIEHGLLARIAVEGSCYERFSELSRTLWADRYNSSLFDRNSLADKLTFEIKDKIFGDFLLALYDKGQDALHDTYDFNIIPLDILGRTYEQYLGWHLVKVRGGSLKIEEKPEVKHAGGVYYTPKYVVDFILKQTLGKKLEEAASEYRKITHIKVLDPACGSGTFLISAYDYLIKTYFDLAIKQNRSDWIVSSADGKVKVLSSEVRRDILRKHIFGIDIDPSAVEVARLSLFLRFIKDELQVSMMSTNLLPNLEENIRCGNSLISPVDIATKNYDIEIVGRINPFDWKSESHGFGLQLKSNDKFNVIVGNPPYIRIQEMSDWYPEEVEVMRSKYSSLVEGNGDIYLLFMEQCLELLSPSGYFSFIQSNKFTKANYGSFIRNHIKSNKKLIEYVNFRDQQIFDEATTYTTIFVIGKGDLEFKYAEVYDLGDGPEVLKLIQENVDVREDRFRVSKISHDSLGNHLWVFPFPEEIEILKKVSSIETRLDSFTEKVFQGFKTGRDSVYCLSAIEDEKLDFSKKTTNLYSQADGDELVIESTLLLPLVKGSEMARYSSKEPRMAIIFPYTRDGKLFSESVMKKEYPLAWKYLNRHREGDHSLLSRKISGGKNMENESGWYGFSRTQALTTMRLPKLLTADIKPYASFSGDPTGSISFNGGAAGGYGLVFRDPRHVDYFLTVLNSWVLDWYHHKFTDIMSGEFYGYEKRFIDHLPIPDPSVLIQKSPGFYNQVCSNGAVLLNLYRQFNDSSVTTRQKEALRKSIYAAEEENLKIVGELYNLAESDIKVIRNNYRGKIALAKTLS